MSASLLRFPRPRRRFTLAAILDELLVAHGRLALVKDELLPALEPPLDLDGPEWTDADQFVHLLGGAFVELGNALDVLEELVEERGA